jgi:hypothetical protein
VNQHRKKGLQLISHPLPCHRKQQRAVLRPPLVLSLCCVILYGSSPPLSRSALPPSDTLFI